MGAARCAILTILYNVLTWLLTGEIAAEFTGLEVL